MHLNMMGAEELNTKLENTHELTKDTMLEKVVLITSSYFCIATEICFILNQRKKDKLELQRANFGSEELDISDITVSEQLTKKDSEAFHAKALHIGLMFLPKDCPLNQYVCQTYKKNYLVPKLKLAEKEKLKLKQLKKNQLLVNSGSKLSLSSQPKESDKPSAKKPVEKIKLLKNPTPKIVHA